jgi:hypothetical protein
MTGTLCAIKVHLPSVDIDSLKAPTGDLVFCLVQLVIANTIEHQLGGLHEIAVIRWGGLLNTVAFWGEATREMLLELLYPRRVHS